MIKKLSSQLPVHLCSVFSREKGSGTHTRGSRTHYHIHIAHPCKIQTKCTNKQKLGRKGVGMAFPLKKALHLCERTRPYIYTNIDCAGESNLDCFQVFYFRRVDVVKR